MIVIISDELRLPNNMKNDEVAKTVVLFGSRTPEWNSRTVIFFNI